MKVLCDRERLREGMALATSVIPLAIMPFAMALLAAGMALFPAAAAVIARRFWTTGPSRIGVFTLAWVFIEWLRGWILTGFPWHLIGYAWGAVLPMMQSTALFGIYGLSLLTVLAAAALIS